MATAKLEFGSELPIEQKKSELQQIFKKVNNGKVGAKISADVVLSFVDRAKIQQLNKQFARNDYATDVLSFNYQEEQALEGEKWGEIVICVEVAQESADKNGIDLSSELKLLLVHGILHLKGLDHKSDIDKTRFERLQNDIMKSLKLTFRTMKYE